MKKSTKRLLMLLLAVLIAISLPIVSFSYSQEYINIPDPNFAAAVRREMGLPEGAPIPRARAVGIIALDLGGAGISNLAGIEYFSALQWLIVRGNQLAAIDVSNNHALLVLDVSWNQLTSLDVSSNCAIMWVSATGNRLTSLDVSRNRALEVLCVQGNYLTTLDISNNLLLRELLASNNQLMEIDISNNHALELLHLNYTGLTTLDVSNNLKLIELFVSDNQLTTLDVSNNITLESLNVGWNRLTALNISNNLALKELFAGNNRLTALDVSSNLMMTGLFIHINNLRTLDISNNHKLRHLSASENLLTSLDVSNNPALERLAIFNNALTTLDISNNPLLGSDRRLLFSLEVQGNHMNSPDDVVGWQENRHLNLNANFRFYPQHAASAPSIWAVGYITRAVELGLVPSLLNRDFTQSTTRAEFTHFAVALYETITESEISGRIPFVDTIDTNVQKAAYIGVVQGVGGGRFDPSGTLTREQAATMLARLAYAIGSPLPEYAATFSDNDAISSWAIDAVGQVQAAGIMSGVGNNMFDPQGTYTREQSIVTMLRLFDFVS